MANIISVINAPFSIASKLHEIVKKYLKKKKIERRFVKSFENEIGAYIDIFKEILDLSEKQMLPIMQTIDGAITVHQMNELLEAMVDMPLIYARMIKAFVNFARACSEVSSLSGFMEGLEETDIVLYDFVITMKNTYVEDNKVKIDGKYYRFFKTYEDEIFKELETEEVEKFTEAFRGYAKKTKHYVEKTALIRRDIRKKYRRNFRVLAKASDRMIVKPTKTIELRAYIPKKLLPTTVLIDELF